MLPLTVLCIDDHPELLKLRKSTLESRGYCVESARNTAAAMSKLENLPAATVLLDYKIEGIDAQALAYQLKQRYPDRPIILLSAYSEMPEALLWLVDEYVMKSEPVERLTEVIDRVYLAQTDKRAA